MDGINHPRRLARCFFPTVLPLFFWRLRLGKPDFIEIKSVTFCGESKVSLGEFHRETNASNHGYVGPGQTTDMGGSTHGGTPKWSVYQGKSIYKWMIRGGSPILGNLHPRLGGVNYTVLGTQF